MLCLKELKVPLKFSKSLKLEGCELPLDESWFIPYILHAIYRSQEIPASVGV